MFCTIDNKMTQIDIKNLLAMFDQTHMQVFFYILIYTIFQFLDAVINVYKTSMTVQTSIFDMSQFWKSLFVVYNRKTRIHKSLPSRWNKTVTIPCHWLTLWVDTFLIRTQENFSHGWVNQMFSGWCIFNFHTQSNAPKILF